MIWPSIVLTVIAVSARPGSSRLRLAYGTPQQSPAGGLPDLTVAVFG